LQALGITLRTDADIRGYSGQKVRADIVAVLEGEYDIGWSLNSDGSYDFIADLGGVCERYDLTNLINCIFNWVYQAKKAWKDGGRI
jgi:hypothetical protein